MRVEVCDESENGLLQVEGGEVVDLDIDEHLLVVLVGFIE